MSQPSSPPPPRRRNLASRVVAALLILALILGALWAIPAVLAETGDDSTERPMSVLDVPEDPRELPGVLNAASSSERPAPEGEGAQGIVAEVLSDSPGSVSASVLDATTGQTLAERAASEPRIPASNQKTLAALTVAEHLDPYARLATTVVSGADPGSITLVAGGDTLLAPGAGDPGTVNGRAGIDDLAQLSARALEERGVSGEVTVGLDTRLFTGPALNPGWAREDVAAGEISPVSPLAFYSHRVPTGDGKDPGSRGERPDHAAQAVAAQFRDRLREHLGPEITVTVGEHPVPEKATELARVESAPVHEQAAYMLEHSDNSLAETLARVAARESGEPGSVAGVQRAIRASLQEHAVDLAGAEIVDASGMALANRISTAALAQATRTLLMDPDLGPYGQGLPLGGATGTLAERFDDPDEQAARGLTRAKTGTLNSVVSLSGHVQRADGRVLVYSLVFNDVRGETELARNVVDRAVAALAQG